MLHISVQELIIGLLIFIVVGIIAVVIIFKYMKKFQKYSKMTYRGLGEKMIFRIPVNKECVLNLFSKKSTSDVFEYEVSEEKNGEYSLTIFGLKKWINTGAITPIIKYSLRFWQGTEGEYIEIFLSDKKKMLFTGRFEAEMYEVISKKINGIPVRHIE